LAARTLRELVTNWQLLTPAAREMIIDVARGKSPPEGSAASIRLPFGEDHRRGAGQKPTPPVEYQPFRSYPAAPTNSRQYLRMVSLASRPNTALVEMT
jgi:hypothetical protein